MVPGCGVAVGQPCTLRSDPRWSSPPRAPRRVNAGQSAAGPGWTALACSGLTPVPAPSSPGSRTLCRPTWGIPKAGIPAEAVTAAQPEGQSETRPATVPRADRGPRERTCGCARGSRPGTLGSSPPQPGPGPGGRHWGGGVKAGPCAQPGLRTLPCGWRARGPVTVGKPCRLRPNALGAAAPPPC